MGSTSNYTFDGVTGTSFAAPHVAGLAGLILSINNSFSPSEIRSIIQYSADDLGDSGFDEDFGWGRINAFSAVKSADEQFTLSGTSTNSQCFWGNVTLTGDLTIPSPYQLGILADATINLNGYDIISSNATITIEDGVTINGLRATLKDNNNDIKGLCSTIQAACNNASDYDKIYVEEGNFNENVTISGVDYLYIDSPTTQATKEFQSLTINNCDYFIGTALSGLKLTMNNCYCPYLGVCHMTTSGSTYSGFYMYNSALSGMVGVIAALKNYALFSQASDIDIEDFYFWESYYGIFATYYSDVYALEGEICSINNYDLSAVAYSDVGAYYCYYDNGTPNILEASGGDVATGFNYDCSSLGKINLSDTNTNISTATIDNSNNPESEAYSKARASYTIIKKQIREEILEDKEFDLSAYHNDFLETAKEFKNFILNNPGEQHTRTALVLTVRCYQAAKEYETMKSFLEEIIDNKTLSDLAPIAKRMMIEYYRETKEYTKALDLADDLMEEYEQDADYVCDLLYAKGLILAYETDNAEKAELCFNEILQNHADNPITAMVSNELGILGKSVEEKENIETSEDTGITFSANPNPFNPIVNLSFNLSEEANVGIVVYDILGREIWKIEETQYVAGKHTVTWQGVNKLEKKVSTGTYIVQLKSDSFQVTKKILLMK